MDEQEIRDRLQEMFAGDDAMDAYPDECANCGAMADPFFVPNEYHEQPDHRRDPGVCTECGCHFGTGAETW